MAAALLPRPEGAQSECSRTAPYLQAHLTRVLLLVERLGGRGLAFGRFLVAPPTVHRSFPWRLTPTQQLIPT